MILVIMVLLLNVSVSLFAPEIICLLGTEEYNDAIYVMPPILLSAVFIFIYDQFVNIELFYEKNKLNAVFALIASVINAILNWIFIPRYGYIAAGYTTFISYFGFMIMHKIYIVYLKKTTDCEDLFRNRFLILLSILCLSLVELVPVLYSQIFLRYLSMIILIIVLLFVCRTMRKEKSEK